MSFIPPAPPEVVTCVFGDLCFAADGGSPLGGEICQYCKNLSIMKLRTKVQAHREMLDKISDLFRERSAEARAREAEGRYLCAIRDPEYYVCAWRYTFDPKRYRLIGPCNDPVPKKGMLCGRCQNSVKTQIEEDPAALGQIQDLFQDNMILGFLCVFWDPRFESIKEHPWRDLRDRWGNRVPHWCPEKRCDQRTKYINYLCDDCYKRISNHPDFSQFFDTQDGSLLSEQEYEEDTDSEEDAEGEEDEEYTRQEN